MADSDCIVVMGSNMAKNHPVAFRWPMKAKVEHGAKIIHVDPRFTRTSAVADIYAPVRAGSDIAFLGGVMGILLALPVNLISTGTVNWQTFSEVAFNFRVDQVVALIGIVLAVISGVLGGLIPAISAARMPITRALREI